jgi:hypothetical protein
MRIKTVALLAAIAVAAAACGGNAADPSSAETAPASQPTSSAPEAGPTTAPAPEETPAASTTTAATPPEADTGEPVPDDAPAAPDFELALGEGGTFRLSDEQKPVYLVFWAEW